MGTSIADATLQARTYLAQISAPLFASANAPTANSDPLLAPDPNSDSHTLAQSLTGIDPMMSSTSASMPLSSLYSSGIDQISLSGPSQLLGMFESLKTSDPTKLQTVLSNAAQLLATQAAQGGAQSEQLAKFAGQFQTAAQNDDLSGLLPTQASASMGAYNSSTGSGDPLSALAAVVSASPAAWSSVFGQ